MLKNLGHFGLFKIMTYKMKKPKNYVWVFRLGKALGLFNITDCEKWLLQKLLCSHDGKDLKTLLNFGKLLNMTYWRNSYKTIF